ncbi:hypothetical protein MTR67_024528 [Solanum verrucosum]|uniref:Protein-S-isoprenylcysteine O-methyltransferase n=1 Tax=Solanum verrucosum TaxID=315347 RepID=A0AAF0QZ57_SOLVR|nr:hypothetical protein MTR67_024528 [Solanum verrucosum]
MIIQWLIQSRQKSPGLSMLGCSRLFVCTGEQNELIPAEIGTKFVEVVKKSGWKGEIELIEVEGEGHVFQCKNPQAEKSKDLIKLMASFIQRKKLAIVIADQAFTHLIKVYHEENLQLVTNGIYRFVRRPDYCGFFIWFVGTQIMLCNPISTVAFTVVVWKFFLGKIPCEDNQELMGTS